jgi:hypothetical protein
VTNEVEALKWTTTIPKIRLTVKTVSSSISKEKGCQISKSPGYENIMPNVYIRVYSTLMDRPIQICHLISCDVSIAAL